MKFANALVVVAIASQLAFPAEARPFDNEDDDAAKLQGQWRLIKLVDPLESAEEIDGLVNTLIVEFRGNDMIMRSRDASSWVWSFTIDASQSPRWMDWDAGQRVWEGIYKLEGDRLTFCSVGRKDPPRPAEFRADAQAPYVLMVFKRIEPR